MSLEARCLAQTWKRMKMESGGGHAGVGSQQDEIVAYWRHQPDLAADPGAFPGRMS
jgi:hypothetical protein